MSEESIKRAAFTCTWASNSKEVLKKIGSEQQASNCVNLELDGPTLGVEKTLGLRWDTD